MADSPWPRRNSRPSACRSAPARRLRRPTRPCRRAAARPWKTAARPRGSPADDPGATPASAGQPGPAGPAPAVAAEAPAPPAEPAPLQAPGNRGEQLLAEAKALYAGGNFRAAREVAGQAKATRLGVDAQADELIAQIGLAEQGGALALYEEALMAVRKGDSQRARSLLTEVAAAGDSLDEGLRAKVQGLLEKLSRNTGSKPGTASTVDAAQDAETIAAQKLNAEVGTRIAEARRYHDIDPDKALAMYQKEIQAVQGSGLPPELTRPMIRRLDVAIELAKKDKAVYLVRMTDKKQREEIEQRRLRILEADGAKKARVKELMDKAMGYYAEGKYVECEAYCKKAMEIDPDELAASMLAFKAKMERRFKADTDIRDAKEEGVVQALQGVDRASITPGGDFDAKAISYATGFSDLTRSRRELMRRLEVKKDPKVLAIEAKLKEQVSLNVDKQPLSEAVKFLQDYTGLNIVVDNKGLADEGLTSASPVTLNVSNIQVKSALRLMLKPLGLTYKVENEVVLITSPQANPMDTYVQTYYVGDLLLPAPKSAGRRDAPPVHEHRWNVGGIDRRGCSARLRDRRAIQ